MLSPGGSAGGGVSGQLSRPAKDPNWLTLEVCREFARNKCGRAEEECKFAHPPPHIDIQNGRVTCCFDSLQVIFDHYYAALPKRLYKTLHPICLFTKCPIYVKPRRK